MFYSEMSMLLGMFISLYLLSYYSSATDSIVLDNGLKTIINFYFSKERPPFNGDSLFIFLLRLGLVYDYLVIYFVFNTNLGTSLYFVSWTYLIIFYTEFWGTFFYSCVFGFVCMSLACATNITLMVKFEYFRNLLREVIGKKAFTDIMGDNPGSTNVIQVAQRTGTAVITAFGIKYGMDYLEFQRNEHLIDYYNTHAAAHGKPPLTPEQSLEIHLGKPMPKAPVVEHKNKIPSIVHEIRNSRSVFDDIKK